MALKTKLFEGRFGLFEITLSAKDKGTRAPIVIKKTAAGTKQSVGEYVDTYLKPAHKKPGRTLTVKYERVTHYEGCVDVMAVPMNRQAT